MPKPGIKLFCSLFVATFVLWLAVELVTGRSALSAWERITRPEDICAYGSCVVVPALLALAGLGVAACFWAFKGRIEPQKDPGEREG